MSGTRTEEEDRLADIEREAAALHERGVIDDRGLNERMAVVAGIRRVRASGRDDLAGRLLRAWLDHAEQPPR